MTTLKHRANGFNLIELLVVMGLIAMLVGLSVPAISGFGRAEIVNRATSAAATSLELARQYAVAHNTYTWVIFAANPGAADSALHVVILGSKDGTRTADGVTPIDLNVTKSYDLRTGAPNLTQLRKAESCAGAHLADGTGTAPTSTISFLLPHSGTDSISFLNAHPELQRTVQFGPTGQARVAESPSQTIEMEISPLSGAPEQPNVSTIRIDGFTGLTRVIRP